MAVPVVYRRQRFHEELPGSFWRWLLAPLALPVWGAYTSGVALRGWLHDHGWCEHQRLPVPVISIGNRAAGGTGKTPACRLVCELLAELGRRPAVLSRGYRGGSEGNDEAQLMGGFPVFCSANRHASGRKAMAAECDVMVLDDGFQHRQLHRDLDIVLIDATRPEGCMLPLGWAREPRSSLGRADILWISRAGLVDPTTLSTLRGGLAPFSGEVICDVHQPGALTPLAGGVSQPASSLSGLPVLLASGIGNPRAFELTAERLGWRVLRSLRYPDHHAFEARDAQELKALAAHLGASLVITGKDAVKLSSLDPGPCLVLSPGDQLDAAGRDRLRHHLIQVLDRFPLSRPGP